jgi:phage-related protein
LVLVKSVEVDLSVKGDADAKARIDDVDKRAEALKKAFPTYKLKIESAAASEKLKVFRAELADATKTRTENIKVKVDDSALAKFAKSAQGAGGPSWLGPALALTPAVGTLGAVTAGAAVGIAGAFTAAAGAVASFGAVAKPVLTDARTAATAVETAQNADAAAVAKVTAQYAYAMSVAKTKAQRQAAYAAEQKGFSSAELAQAAAISKAYANLSPAQIALSKQLGAMADAWDAVKAAETPVVAGALQPWLKSVTALTKNLAPVIAAVSPVIAYLGVQFDALVNSAAFKGFRDFIAGTGTAAVSAGGSTIIDLVKSFMILLPQFDPLIREAVGWIAALGPAVLKWSSSKKAAGDIQGFIQFFSRNGPAAGEFLRNVGGALKALAPGLTSGGAAELRVLSDFFGFIAKLPPAIAKPLAEVAGALLIMNKLGVFSVGIKLIGLGGAGAAEGGAAEDAAGAAGLWSRLLPGVRLAGGVLIADVIISTVLKTVGGGPGKPNPFDNPFGGANPANPVKGAKPNALSSWDQLGADIANIWNSTWNNTITRTAKGFHDLAGWFDTGRHDVAATWDALGHYLVSSFDVTRHQVAGTAAGLGHDVAGSFDTTRHQVSSAWDTTWNNTVARAQRGFHDTAGVFDQLRHGVATELDQVRAGAALAWNQLWASTVSRVSNGVSTVVSWFRGLPGKIGGALGNAGATLRGWGAAVISGLLSGMTSVIGSVWNFIKGIPGRILSFLGIKSPPQWAIDAGKHIMNGLGIGMNQAQAALIKNTKAAAAAAAGAVSSGTTAGHMSAAAIAALWTSLGGPAYAAANMARIAYAESGDNPSIVQAGQPPGLTGYGLYQITPTSGIWQNGAFGNLLNAANNTRAAISLFRGSGYGPWTSDPVGSSLVAGGLGYASGTASARPGWAWVGERGPEMVRFRGGEQVIPARAIAGSGGRGGALVQLEVTGSGHGTFDAFLLKWIQEHVRVKGGGNVQHAFGRR